MTDLQRVEYINKRLKELIEESKLASPTKKVFMRIGYKLFVEEKRKLLSKKKDQLGI
jgi:chorismate mutase